MRYWHLLECVLRSETARIENNGLRTLRVVPKYEDFSGPYFFIFGLNTESVRIQSKYRKIRTRKNSVLDTFHAVEVFNCYVGFE